MSARKTQFTLQVMSISRVSKRKNSPWINQLFQNVSLDARTAGIIEGIFLKNIDGEIKNVWETRDKLDLYERCNPFQGAKERIKIDCKKEREFTSVCI